MFEEADLGDEDVELFDALDGTRNFEVVLDALRVSRLVCDQLEHDADEVEERYEAIKESLIAAVNDVHVPWALVEARVLTSIGQALLRHSRIYSTNYDLLIYWSLMETAERYEFGDYFWNQGVEFNLGNAEPSFDMKLVHYLHGGLHIYRLPDGRTVKRVAPSGLTLLSLLGSEFQGVDLPLFVSEGTSADKMKVIRSSDYLSFVYQSLSADEGDMVILGHGLSNAQDGHIVRALQSHPDRRLAISVRPGRAVWVVAQKAAMLQHFSDAAVRFFDSTTHPLGDPALRLMP